MVVCHCNVVSDRAIRAAVADGTSDVAEIAETCGAGTGCGGCLPAIEDLLEEAAMAFSRPADLIARQAERRRMHDPHERPMAIPA